MHGREERLLDDVDVITSVSGGSFTAAYYRLFGERIFADYETRFLRRNVQGELIRAVFNPLNWFDLFSSLGPWVVSRVRIAAAWRPFAERRAPPFTWSSPQSRKPR